ncbi:hypothetical protein [Burkholderia gladioli]|uniref:hypothetical protein n=1 Tax=Burkholderia gladioli TaxID=28095 RepID=UPI00163EAA0D|nr:hypothetical protein [Burkholderia gladioli]
MKSAVIKKAANQLLLDFEPGLTERHTSVRDCVATGVYRRGLKKVAIDLDQAPSNLSVQLSDDTSRHFSLDSFERYLEKTGDLTPIYYLVEKFLGDKRDPKREAIEQIQQLGPQLMALLQKAGVAGA